MRDIGPRAVSRTVLVRLARLPADAVGVARAVAVLGDSADLANVAALTELSERPVAEATAALARADILRPEAPLGFVHPLVRDAVYRDLAPAQRELLHAAAAAVLRDAGAPVEQVAAQLLAAPRRGEAWAGEALRDAGRLAVARGAAENAVAFLRRAIEEPVDEQQHAHLLLELGLAEGLTDGPAAVEHLHGAYDALTDPGLRSFTANILARLELHVVSASAGSGFAREAALALEPGSDERMQLESVELIAGFWDAMPERELERLHPYRDPQAALRGGAGAKMLAGLAAWEWTTAVGPVDAVCELAVATLAGGQLVESDEGLVAMAPFLVLSVADHPGRWSSGTTSWPARTAAARSTPSRRSTSGAASRCCAAATSPTPRSTSRRPATTSTPGASTSTRRSTRPASCPRRSDGAATWRRPAAHWRWATTRARRRTGLPGGAGRSWSCWSGRAGTPRRSRPATRSASASRGWRTRRSCPGAR